MDRINERRLTALVFAFYAVILSWSTIMHGMWLDELQPWCLARDSGSLLDLYNNTRHEFHPPVWYMLLYFLTRFTSDPFGMQVLQWLIVMCTAAVVLWRSPFTLWWRAGILFGYFFLFEYGVMARNYGLVVLGLLVAVDSRKNHGTGWRWALALGMAALSHLWGTVMAVAMLMGALCSRKRDRLIGPALLIVIACGAAVMCSWPASHAPRLSVVDDVQLPNDLARIGTSTTQGLLPWPNLSNDPIWKHNVIHATGRMLSALLGLALIALLWWCTPREVSARVFFWTSFVGCLALPIVGGAYDVRHYGPLWIGWLILQHKAHGKLPWKDLFEPAIKLSEEGFAISQRMSVSIAGSAARIKAQGEPGSSYFLNADGTAKAAGTLLKNPEFAATLKAIAAGGADAFYKGDIAKDIVAKVVSHPTNPGKLALDDLSDYTHKVREPVCGVYRVQYRVCGMPAPSSGVIAVLQTLGLLQGFDLAAMKPNTLDSVHVVSEAYRLAYADRALYVADPDFVNVPQAGLINADYLKERAKLISLQKSMGVPVAGIPPGVTGATGKDSSLALPSTTHMSIIDNAGNAVSMTTTIENGFGSLQMVRGFLLNNQLTDFSFTATDAAGNPIANSVQAGKRPRSSMAPTNIFNAATGDLEGVVGSPGSTIRAP